jgi:hypothetical protein
MKNNLSLDYGAPKLHIMPPVVPHDHWPENKRFCAAPSSKRIPNLNSFNKLHPHNALRRLQCAFASLAAWSAPGSNLFLFLPAIYRSLSSHASASAIRNSPQFLRARYLLQLWRIEFIRDWHSLLNSFAFPRMKRGLLSWLSQPLSSKHSPPQ